MDALSVAKNGVAPASSNATKQTRHIFGTLRGVSRFRASFANFAFIEA